MRRGTKIQKLKQALPGIVKDVRHYAKPRVKLHNEGLGDYYTEGVPFSEPEGVEKG